MPQDHYIFFMIYEVNQFYCPSRGNKHGIRIGQWNINRIMSVTSDEILCQVIEASVIFVFGFRRTTRRRPDKSAFVSAVWQSCQSKHPVLAETKSEHSTEAEQSTDVSAFFLRWLRKWRSADAGGRFRPLQPSAQFGCCRQMSCYSCRFRRRGAGPIPTHSRSSRLC